MRLASPASLVLAALALASPLVVSAQFPAPNPEELKMTAEPKAPGAPAIYLDREQINIDNKHYESLYERMKVLTEKGKDLATVRIPYEHGAYYLKDVEARTVHPDGTIVPLDVKPTDLVDFKTRGLQMNMIVFTMPSVEVGSVLEYRVKFSYDDETWIPPIWNIQQKYFTREAHFQYHASEIGYNSTSFTTNLPDPNKIVKEKGTWRLDLTDIPAQPDEDWMPPLNTVNWRVQFYYSYKADNSTFWQTTARAWAGDIEDFIKPTPLLTNAAQQLTAASDTPAQKAEKIYAAVQKLENTSFTRTLTEAERKKQKLRKVKSLDDIWKNQRGNSAALALLYMGLARAAGLTVYPMQVVDRDRAIFDPDYHSDDQLDDYLAIVVLDGKEMYLNPGEKFCPFGQLHWKHTLATGLRETPNQGTSVARTPSGSYKNSTLQRIANLAIAPDGAVSGSIRLIMTGPESLHWRQETLREDSDAVKKSFEDALNDMVPEGVHAQFDHFIGLEDPDSALAATATVTGTLGSATGKRMFLPGLFFASRAKHPFVAEDKRLTPIDVHHPQLTEDDVTYTLPAGFTLEAAPQKTALGWPQHAALHIDAKAAANSVDVTRSLAYNYVLLGASDYADLHSFYQKIASADQQQVVLIRSQSALAH